MSSYKISYKQIRQNPELANMLEALEKGMDLFGIDFYLIGAVARDVWMQGIHNTPPKRTTGDIDFAVLINKAGVYEELREYLIEKEEFNPSKENAFVLVWKNSQQVDLMPFGRIEEGARIKVEGTGLTTQHVAGFKEVYESGLPEVELEGRHTFKFCTIPGIVLLKLIAWNDRPEIRKTDIEDISDLLLHYFEMFSEHIYDNHSDLFWEEDDENYFIKISAQVLGREIGVIAKKNASLQTLILRILQENTQDPTKSNIAAIMAKSFDNTIEDNITLLLNMKQGIEEIIAA